MEDDEFDILSYKKLEKMIIENHPSDVDTLKRFPIFSRVTVKNYYKKLFDICCILKIMKVQKDVVFSIKKFLLSTICKCCKRKKFKWAKPKSMSRLPDSESSDEDDDENMKI